MNVDGEAWLVTDYKSALQELIQANSRQHLSYTIVGEEGPEHLSAPTLRWNSDGAQRALTEAAPITISTRRLFARFSGVLLSVIARVEPMPTALIRSEATPRETR